MGDVLLTTPLLRALRVRHPEAWISYLTKSDLTSLLDGNPRINEVVGYDPTTSLRSLGKRLSAQRFTHCLDLHGSLRSRALRWLVPGRWRGYPKHRLARSVLIRTKRDIYRDRRPVAERYFDSARDLGVSPDDGPLEHFIRRSDLEAASRYLSEHDLGQGRTLMAVSPGARHATKRWPVERWRELVTRLTERGSDVVVLGGPADRDLADQVAQAGGSRAASAAGRVELGVTAGLLKLGRCAISGDTGLMHLATAVGTPVVALFGPTVEAFGFFPYRARATVIERPLGCRPCSAMGGPVCPLGHHRCLVEIGSDEVFEAIRRLPR
jgi:heptosyltransferase-2